MSCLLGAAIWRLERKKAMHDESFVAESRPHPARTTKTDG
jgi:hypothetical protein